MEWAGHVVHRRKRHAWEKLKESDRMKDLGVDGWFVLKMI
jgi:hypothetical protein